MAESVHCTVSVREEGEQLVARIQRHGGSPALEVVHSGGYLIISGLLKDRDYDVQVTDVTDQPESPQ